MRALTYTNQETVPLSSLYFHLLPNGGASYGNGHMQVSQVMQERQPAQTALSKQDTLLEVKLASPLAVGASTQVEMDFQSEIPQNFGSTGYGIYNVSDGVIALDGWYPILAVYDQKGWNLEPPSAIGDSVYSDDSLYKVDLRVPSELVLVSTGITLNRQDANPWSQYQLVSGPVREFFISLSSQFQVVSQSTGDTQVNSYYLEGDQARGSRP